MLFFKDYGKIKQKVRLEKVPKIKIAGLRQVINLGQITITSFSIPSCPLNYLLAPLAENQINLEFLLFHQSSPQMMNLVLAVKHAQIAAALGLLRKNKEIMPTGEVFSREGIGMISLFPHKNQAAVVANFLAAFQEAGVKILAMNLSLSAISALVAELSIPDVINSLSDYFSWTG